MVSWWKNLKNNENKETEAFNQTSTSLLNDDFTNTLEEFSPKTYEDVEAIANTLILQKPVKLDLGQTVISDRRRIIDFLCGVAYVLNFSVQKTGIDSYEFKLNK